MKLSEAIRAGAKLRPQARHGYRVDTIDGMICTCALGAAYEAITGQLPPPQGHPDIRFMPAKFHVLFGDAYVKNAERILEWNDGYGLTREEIAEKLSEMGC